MGGGSPRQLHPTGRGFVMEGVDAEGAMPPPSVVFLHVVAVVRSVGDASEQIPNEWTHDCSKLIDTNTNGRIAGFDVLRASRNQVKRSSPWVGLIVVVPSRMRC